MWCPVDDGTAKEKRGSENGVIVRDEEHPHGARITLEQSGDTAPFSITCGIYGWMVHTRFFANEFEASSAFDEMKSALAAILAIIPAAEDSEVEQKAQQVSDALFDFVERYG